MLDVICVGALTLDTIAVVDTIPGDDQRVLSSTMTSAGGGPAATAAVALARLGASVGFCGVVGDDDAGVVLRRELEKEGVDTSWIVVDSRVHSARSVVLVSTSTGGRTIVTVPAPAPDSTAVPTALSRWLHADQTGFAPARTALRAAPGAMLSVDAGNPLDSADLSGIDLFVPSLPALREQYPAASTVLAAMTAAQAAGASSVVATDGSRGTYLRTADSAVLVPSFAVDVQSTLGAGDVFHGALLAGVVAGLELERAVSEANAAAALSCRGLDGRSAIPTRSELDEFLGTAKETQ